MRRILLLPMILAAAAAIRPGPTALAAGSGHEGAPAPDTLAAPGYPVFTAPDTVLIEAGPDPGTAARLSLLLRPGRTAASDSTGLLGPRLPGLGREPLHLSPFARTVYAADRGANAGLLVGGVGNLLGLWDEDTACALMGAGAALGAILHGAEAAAGSEASGPD